MASGRPVRVLYVQYTNPAHYPPLVHGAELLRLHGCHLAFVGIGTPDDPQQIARDDQTDCRLIRPAPAGWRGMLHYSVFTVWALWRAIRYRPDWLYASDALSCVPAWLIGWLPGVNVVYHEHDAPATDGRGRSAFWWIILRARAAVASRAALRIAPGEARARLVEAVSRGGMVEVVWNCPLLRQVAGPRRATPGLRVVYHGTIVPRRVPLTVIEALALTPDDVTLTIIGYETVGYPGHVEALLARAEALGIAHRVTCRPAISRDELMQGAADFDAGLCLLPTASTDVNEQSMIGASNKPFDYMAAGMAVIVPDRPEWREAFVDAGYGVACRAEEPREIARALNGLRDDEGRRLEMGEAGRARIQTGWCYDRTFRPVVERLLARQVAIERAHGPGESA